MEFYFSIHGTQRLTVEIGTESLWFIEQSEAIKKDVVEKSHHVCSKMSQWFPNRRGVKRHWRYAWAPAKFFFFPQRNKRVQQNVANSANSHLFSEGQEQEGTSLKGNLGPVQT